MEMLHTLVAVSFLSHLYLCLLYRSTLKIQQGFRALWFTNTHKGFPALKNDHCK